MSDHINSHPFRSNQLCSFRVTSIRLKSVRVRSPQVSSLQFISAHISSYHITSFQLKPNQVNKMEVETRSENLKRLGDRMLAVLEECDAFSKKIFDEGRYPTQDEWLKINHLDAQYYSYAEIRQHFFPEKQEEDTYLEEFWDRYYKRVGSKIKTFSHFSGY